MSWLTYRIVAVLVGRVHVYRFNNPPHKLHTFETTDNDRGTFPLQYFTDFRIMCTISFTKSIIISLSRKITWTHSARRLDSPNNIHIRAITTPTPPKSPHK